MQAGANGHPFGSNDMSDSRAHHLPSRSDPVCESEDYQFARVVVFCLFLPSW
jgi:hypothetical protein